MPFIYSKDNKGYFVKWGRSGTKYYYRTDSKKSETMAINKAKKQASAIEISKGKFIVKPK